MVEVHANDEEFTMEVREASPSQLLMKIESFSLLSKHEIESPEFEAGDCKWRLVIHPNGLFKSENDEEDHISVYLTIVETSSLPIGWEVTAAVRIFLYNQVLDNYLCFQSKTRRFHPVKTHWGFSKLISKERLRAPGNGFLIDDSCVFGAEVDVIKTQCVTQCVSVKKFDIPYKREWKISRFSKLGKVWYCEEFTFGDHKWYIVLYPNGYSSEEGRSVSMYLFLAGAKSFPSHKKVKADFYLRIKNQLDDQHRSLHKSHWFTSSVYARGWGAFIPLSDMRDSKKGFLVDDGCIIEVEISSTDTMNMGVQENRKWLSYFGSIFGKKRAPSNGFLVDDNCVFGAKVAVTKTLEWKISSYSKLGEVWCSEKFTVGDHEWYLVLYPNGYSSEEGRSVSMYLFLDGAYRFTSHERVKADFYLRIKNQRNDRHCSIHASPCFTSSSNKWWWLKSIPLSIMRNPKEGFVVEDCCIVEVEISARTGRTEAESPAKTQRTELKFLFWFLVFCSFWFYSSSKIELL